jgi:hypothetical protein
VGAVVVEDFTEVVALVVYAVTEVLVVVMEDNTDFVVMVVYAVS